ncbi:MAG: outer membrane protein transport protein [Myxococcales bacterium]|nr:outer membrane protein transport protein [Myxococcales bacterium]
MFRHILVTCAALGALSGLAPAAHAAGFYVPERGARALSMGGAFIAGADDMNAQWLNPAALTRLSDDLNLYLDVGLIFASRSFDRQDDPEVTRKDPAYASGFPTVENEGPPFVDPSLGVATHFGLDDFVFALGAYGPYAGTNEWPEDGPQRYSLINLNALELFIQASVAWRVSDELAVGVGLQWVFTDITQRLQISSYPGAFGWAEAQDMDTLAEVKVKDVFSPSANFGLLVTPVPALDIGLSVQLPVSVEATGTVETRTPSNYYFKDVTVTGDAMKVSLDFPPMFRLGVRVHDGDLWSAELAAVYEMWSVMDGIVVAPGDGGVQFDNVPGIGSYRVRPFDIRLEHDDSFSLRLGGFVRLAPVVTLRAGAFYEKSPIKDRFMSVLVFDNDKAGGTLGATLDLGAVEIDLALAYVKLFERTVTDSEKYQVNPLYDEDAAPYGEAGPHVVGNGTYEGSYFMVSTALSAGF